MDLQRLNQYPIEVYRGQMANGLTVHVLPQDRMRVHLQYTLNAGAYQDVVPGTAHFLEHALLNTSHDIKRASWIGRFDRMGASSNGTTHWLSTSYEITGHAQNAIAMLEGLTRAVYASPENDRAFRHARKVVMAEALEQNIGARHLDSWRAKQQFPDDTRLWVPLIGAPGSLRKMVLEDLRAIHARYYAPHNMLLTIAGGVGLDVLPELLAGITPLLDSVSADGRVFPPRPNRPYVRHGRVFGARRIRMPSMPCLAFADLPIGRASLDTYRRLAFAARLLTSSNGLVTRAMRHERGGVYGVRSTSWAWPGQLWRLEAVLRRPEARRFFDAVLGSLDQLSRECIPDGLFDELRMQRELSYSDDRFSNDVVEWVDPLEDDWLADDYSFVADPMDGITLERVAEDVRRHWPTSEISTYLLTGASA